MKSPAAMRIWIADHKWTARLAVAALLYTLGGFFLLPALIQWQLRQRLPPLTHRQATVAQVKCNPYALSLTVRGFALTETNGEPFAAFDEFYANFQLSSIFRRAWFFREIRLVRPFGQITYRPDGQFNFANLFNQTNAAKPSPPPRVLIDDLIITNGTVAFADQKRPTPFRTAFTPIKVHLTKFSTRPDRKNPYSFTASDDAGATFSWAGNFSINPLRSAGSIELGGVKIKKYSPYLQDFARVEILDGELGVRADYRYDGTTNALDLEFTQAGVDVTRLQIKSIESGETVVSIPSFSLRHAQAAVLKQTARVAAIQSTGGSILARREKDGRINLLALLIPPASTTAKSPTHSTPAWSAVIDEISFENYAIQFEDKMPGKPAVLQFDQLALKLNNVSTLTNAPVNAAFAARFQQTGTISIEGTALPFAPSAEVRLALTHLDLSALQPYVEEQVKLIVKSGGLSLNGLARYGATQPGVALASFAGNVAITNFSTLDDVLFKDFTRWDALAIDGIQLDVQPEKLAIDQIKFAGLQTSLHLGPDKRSNFETILRDKLPARATTSNAPPASAPPAATATNTFVATVGALRFEHAAIHFSDQSLQPHGSFDVQEFSGTITNLSSAGHTRAAVDLRGKVDAPAPFHIRGQINPFPQQLYANLAIVFSNTDLTAFTPYMEKYGGYPLQKGKLSLDLHYLIDQKQVTASNVFHLDRFTLGPKNNSPDATKLPVKLAVALLKDINGRIDLNVPVQGRLDDPKFRVAPIIWKVVVNLLVKAATSPFALLGGMFGGGDELSFVEFQPGRAFIPESETNKLNTLIRALTNRPALNLEIAGAVNITNDGPALARRKLELQIKTLHLQEQAGSSKPARSVDEVKLEPKEYERLLRQLYKKTIGRYKPAEVLAQERAAATNSPPAPLANAAPRPASEQRGATRLLSPALADQSASRRP